MTTKVQLRRIEILIEELEKLRKAKPKGKFNMRIWCALKRAATRAVLRKQIREAVKNPCGTSACLAGKAGLIPRIRKMGFKWDTIDRWGDHGGFRYKKFIREAAVRAFFGDDVYWGVFNRPHSITTLFQGINALKSFVRESNQ